MKLHIFGASGTGVTTLGNYLSSLMNIPYIDSDEFYWEKTSIPFTVRREPILRNAMIMEHLPPDGKWILGGSIIKWDLPIKFDLAVFLWVPPAIRIERLKAREYERYGDDIFNIPERHSLYNEFIEWCAGYDNNTAHGRTLLAHEQWMQTLRCPILKLEGDLSTEERADKIKERLVKELYFNDIA